MEHRTVKKQWMVLFKHLGMKGGVWDYGEAEIIEFTETKNAALQIAENHIKNDKGFMCPRVWVLFCDRTYLISDGEPAYIESEK